jgi:hypothetical protein
MSSASSFGVLCGTAGVSVFPSQAAVERPHAGARGIRPSHAALYSDRKSRYQQILRQLLCVQRLPDFDFICQSAFHSNGFHKVQNDLAQRLKPLRINHPKSIYCRGLRSGIIQRMDYDWYTRLITITALKPRQGLFKLTKFGFRNTGGRNRAIFAFDYKKSAIP